MSMRRTPACALALFIAVLWLVPVVGAQDTTASRAGRARLAGSVVDARSGAPLPGVTVQILGTQAIGSTNEEGRFQIGNVPVGVFAVEARRLGFAPGRNSNVRFRADSVTTLKFELTDAPLRLDQVVVSATINAVEASKSTVAVDHLSAEDMPVASASAQNMILGKVAGAGVVRASGRPGDSTNILLRTPIAGFDYQRDAPGPLYIVDGVYLNQTQGNTMQDLESMDIESIEVLKGAAASALYGSRAAAGVIVVSTKRGRSLSLGSVEYNVRVESGQDQYVSSLQKNQHHNFRQDDNGNWLNATGTIVPRAQRATTALNIMDQPYKNTQLYDAASQMFEPSRYSTITTAVQGNTAATNFYAAYSRNRQPGVVNYNQGFLRQTFKLNLGTQVRDNLSLDFSVGHARSKDNTPATNFDDYYRFDPDVNLLSTNPVPPANGFPYNIVPDSVTRATNPLYAEYINQNFTRRVRTEMSVHAAWRPLEWIDVISDLSYDRGDVTTNAFTPLNTVVNNNGSLALSTGRIAQGTSTTDGITYTVGPTFTKQVGDLTARATVRGELQREETPSATITGTDLRLEGIQNISAAATIVATQAYQDRRTEAGVGSLGLSYKERYVGDFLFRRDGSSLFGPNHRWNNFFRASGAWLLGDESWFPFEGFSTFKLRYSIGTAGNRPAYSDQFETLAIQQSGTITRTQLGNKDLGPTVTHEQEMGLDFTYRQRLSGSISYAFNHTDDSFISVPAPSLSGYTNVLANAGAIKGNTLELTLQGQILSNANGLNWTMLFTGDRSRNLITEYRRTCFADGSDGFHYRCSGVTFGTMWGQVFVHDKANLPKIHQNSGDQFDINDDGFVVPVGAGNTWRDGIAKNLWGTSVLIDGRSYAWGIPLVQQDSNGANRLTQIGDGNPAFHFGWGNTLRYKGWRFYFQTSGQLGGDVYAKSIQNYWNSGDWRDVDQYGKPDEEKKSVLYYNRIATASAYNEAFVRNGTYLNLQELSFGYAFAAKGKRVLEQFGVNRIQVDLIGRNLATLSSYPGLDVMAGTNTRREDAARYPLTRTITGAVSVTF